MIEELQSFLEKLKTAERFVVNIGEQALNPPRQDRFSVDRPTTIRVADPD